MFGISGAVLFSPSQNHLRLLLRVFLPRHVLNVSEVEEAERRIREWRLSPEAKEEGASCPIAEVHYLCIFIVVVPPV